MILDDIIQQKKESLKITPTLLPRVAPHYNFLEAITKNHFQVIAEVKEKSPSTGLLCQPYEPEKIALRYKTGGASAISVLTDTPFFGGKMADIQLVKDAVDLPILCKDFIIDPIQIQEAYSNGADAVLLIMRILTLEQAQQLKTLIESLNMTALIEIFDKADLEKALQIHPKILLVNHRNLDSLSMDYDISSLIANIPDTIPIIAASGINHPNQILSFHPRIKGLLIGTGLLKSQHPEKFIQRMIKPKIKICGITRLKDALLCESLGAAFIGFVFEKSSPRFIDYTKAKEIIQQLTFAQPIGIFVHQSADEIETAIKMLNLWGVQIYSNELTISHHSCKVIKSIRVDGNFSLPTLNDNEYVLLDTHNEKHFGGTGKTWDWSLMPSSMNRCFLSGGINIDNIRQAKLYNSFAIDLSSGVETTPGKKDSNKLHEFFEVFYE